LRAHRENSLRRDLEASKNGYSRAVSAVLRRWLIMHSTESRFIAKQAMIATAFHASPQSVESRACESVASPSAVSSRGRQRELTSIVVKYWIFKPSSSRQRVSAAVFEASAGHRQRSC
jgi:hypothetical protein